MIWKVRDRSGTAGGVFFALILLWIGLSSSDFVAKSLFILAGIMMLYLSYCAYFVLDFEKGSILKPAYFKKPGAMKSLVNLANIEKWHVGEKVNKKTGDIKKTGIVFTLKEGTYNEPNFWKRLENNNNGIKANQILLPIGKGMEDILELLDAQFKK